MPSVMLVLKRAVRMLLACPLILTVALNETRYWAKITPALIWSVLFAGVCY